MTDSNPALTGPPPAGTPLVETGPAPAAGTCPACGQPAAAAAELCGQHSSGPAWQVAAYGGRRHVWSLEASHWTNAPGLPDPDRADWFTTLAEVEAADGPLTPYGFDGNMTALLVDAVRGRAVAGKQLVDPGRLRDSGAFRAWFQGLRLGRMVGPVWLDQAERETAAAFLVAEPAPPLWLASLREREALRFDRVTFALDDLDIKGLSGDYYRADVVDARLASLQADLAAAQAAAADALGEAARRSRALAAMAEDLDRVSAQLTVAEQALAEARAGVSDAG